MFPEVFFHLNVICSTILVCDTQNKVIVISSLAFKELAVCGILNLVVGPNCLRLLNVIFLKLVLEVACVVLGANQYSVSVSHIFLKLINLIIQNQNKFD